MSYTQHMLIVREDLSPLLDSLLHFPTMEHKQNHSMNRHSSQNGVTGTNALAVG